MVAAFWIVDTSPRACTLKSPTELRLLDSAGTTRLSATVQAEPISLSAGTPMPTAEANPDSSQVLADVSLLWPTDANAALQAGATDGLCPTPDFTPSAARISFAATSLTVTNLTIGTSRVAICGSHIRLGASALGAS
jgi:hypothetical protein